MRFRTMSLLGFLTVGLAVYGMAATPLPPRTVAYQGRLTTPAGTPVTDGSYNLNFSIWNHPNSVSLANKKWESGAVSVMATGGLFNVNLGAPGQAVLPDSIFVQDTNLYLGITVNGGAELTPRTKLTSVAYAYVAGTVPDSSLYSTKIINEAGITYSSAPGAKAVPYDVSGTHTDMVTVSITVPTGGVIMVQASGQFGQQTTSGFGNNVSFQIDQTAGGFDDFSYYYYSGTDQWPNSAYQYHPFSISRPYYVISGGTYTFRLEARTINSGASNYCWTPVISATFYPTYYGLLVKSSSPGAHIDTAYVDGQVPARTTTPQLQHP